MSLSLPIAEVADVNPRMTSELSSDRDREVNFVPMSHLSESGQVSINGTRPLREVSKGYTYFANGDVLVAKITPCMENGKAAFVNALPTGVGFGSTEFHVLRPTPKVEGRYLFYMVWNPHFRQEAARNMTGSAGQKRVPASFFARFQIPVPPLREQRRIADILDKSDAIRRKRRQAWSDVALLDRVVFRNMFGDTASNDRGWPTIRVDEAGDVQLGRQRAPKYQTGKFTRPYLRVANVFEDRLDLSDVLSMDFHEKDYERYKLEYGDILLNEGQSTELVGRPAMWRDEIEHCCFQNTLVRFRAYHERVYPEYALAVFLDSLRRGAFARVSSKTSSVAHLGAARFAAMDFPLPPKELQERYVTARTALTDLKQKAATAATSSGNLFETLVQRAFRGEL